MRERTYGRAEEGVSEHDRCGQGGGAAGGHAFEHDRRGTWSARLQVEAEVQGRRTVRERADGQVVDAGVGDRSGFRQGQPTAGLEQHRAGTTGPVLLEASGGLTLSEARAVADTGVDYLAIGALTHSAPALDFGLDLESG